MGYIENQQLMLSEAKQILKAMPKDFNLADGFVVDHEKTSRLVFLLVATGHDVADRAIREAGYRNAQHIRDEAWGGGKSFVERLAELDKKK